MKTNAIVRIVLFSLTIVVLLGLLAAGMGLFVYGSNTNNRSDSILVESTPAPINATAISSTDIYAIPSSNGEVLGKLEPGDEVTILRQETVNETAWALMATGWVPMECLNPDTSAESMQINLVAPVTAVEASGIRKLNIEWVAGDITIEPKEGIDQIQFSESAVENSKYAMHYKVSGSKLTIQFSRENITGFGINLGTEVIKDLTVWVPMGWVCDELQLEVASADVEVRNLTIDSIDFDGASGTCDFTNCIVDDLDMDTASGDVTFSGELNTLDFDAASASFFGILNNCPHQIDMDAMSGDLELALPSDCGFTVSMDGLSSSFHSDYPTTYTNGNQVYGDGRCRISVDGMSCDVYISKSAPSSLTPPMETTTPNVTQEAPTYHQHTEHCTTDPDSCPDNAAHHTHTDACNSDPGSCPDSTVHHPEN